MTPIDFIAATIEIKTNAPARIRSREPAGGGCINHAEILTLDDGRRFFAKSNPSPLPGMFEREAEGLAALKESGAIRVPEVIGTGADPVPFIVLECIETGPPKKGFFEAFGRRFAQLHRDSSGQRFGFDHDNYIGSTPQPNGWLGDWPAFWRDRRIGFQLQLARKNGHADAAMTRAGEKLLDRLPELLAEPVEPACLLHGDLWGGNYLTDSEGEPVLIDPAAYYGRREADLAMTMLFGGFDPAFYRAYEEVWPLAGGWRERIELYKLYHLLNHQNLFGGGYYGGCMSILKRFA